MKTDVKNSVKELKDKGDVANKQGNYAKAVKYYKRALNIKSSKEIFFNLGIALNKFKKNDEARKAFENAIAIDSKYYKAQFSLGKTLISLHRYKEAWEIMMTFIQHNPKHTKSLYLLKKCTDEIGAKIFFGIVDLKFTPDKQIKILEFGRGMMSGTKGYDKIYSRNTIKDKLAKKLSEFGLEVYLNASPGVYCKNDKPLLKKLNKKNKYEKNKKFKVENIATYRGIYAGRDYLPVTNDILLLSDSIPLMMMCDDKVLMHRMVELSAVDKKIKNEKVSYRPAAMVLPKKYHSNLAAKIQKTIPANLYVLKEPAGVGGKGVKVVAAKNLDKELSGLFNMKEEAALMINKNKNNFNFLELFNQFSANSAWMDGNPSFLVEKYEASMPTQYKGENYDGTMRVHFIAYRHLGKVDIIPIGSYWKLPPKPIKEGFLRESTVSSFTSTEIRSVKVSPNIEQEVYRQIKNILPNLFSFAFKYNIEEYIAQFTGAKSTEQEKKYAVYLLARLTDCYNHLGKYDLAFDAIKKLQKFPDTDTRALFLEGQVYHNMGQYKEALDSFDDGLKSQPLIPKTYFERGRTLLQLGQIDKAKDSFESALQRSAVSEGAVRFELFQILDPEQFNKYITIGTIIKPTSSNALRILQPSMPILHGLVEKNKIEDVLFIIKQNLGDLEQIDFAGRTPIHIAVQYGYLKLLKTLVRFGANIFHTDNYGWNILHKAVEKKHLNVIKFLLGYPKLLSMKTTKTHKKRKISRNYTPVDIAKKKCYFDIEKLLAAPAIKNESFSDVQLEMMHSKPNTEVSDKIISNKMILNMSNTTILDRIISDSMMMYKEHTSYDNEEEFFLAHMPEKVLKNMTLEEIKALTPKQKEQLLVESYKKEHLEEVNRENNILLKKFECFDAEKQYEIGNELLEDNNHKDAFEWFVQSAKNGFPEAQIKVGNMYIFGVGVKQNIKKGTDYYFCSCTTRAF